MRFVSCVLVLCTIIACVQCDPLWKVFCQGKPLYRGRADPIVDPGRLAQHSHKVFGGNNFDYGNPATSPEAYGDHIFASSCTTCSISIDKSVYWVPDLYYRWDNGSISLVPDGGLTVYYPSRAGPSDGDYKYGTGNYKRDGTYRWHAIPRGLRMVAGQSTRRYYNESIVEHKAVSYACLSSTSNGPETGEFPTATRTCDNGLRAQVWFPMCWDGVNLDSPNHMSHMSYPVGRRPDGGDCPSTHPIKFPGIFFEVLFSVDKFPHGQGVNRFLWSNGDTTGNGLHGDFLNGWDPEIMQAALGDASCDIDNTCIGNCPAKCAPFTKYVYDQQCSIAKSLPGYEDLGINHMISHLPGCNPITGGSTTPVTACTGAWPQTSIDSSTRVAIRSSNGLYATNKNNTISWSANVAQADLSYSEMFTFVPSAAKTAIQSEITLQFASDNKRGDTPFLFNRGNPGDWELFTINYAAGATGPTQAGAEATILANSNGKYLVLNSDNTIQSSAATAADASKFYIVDPNAGVADTRTNQGGFKDELPPADDVTKSSDASSVARVSCLMLVALVVLMM